MSECGVGNGWAVFGVSADKLLNLWWADRCFRTPDLLLAGQTIDVRITLNVPEASTATYASRPLRTYGGHRRKSCADFEGDASEDQLLAAGRLDGASHPRVVESIDR